MEKERCNSIEENSCSEMGRFCRQWLPKIRICCHESVSLSEYCTNLRNLSPVLSGTYHNLCMWVFWLVFWFSWWQHPVSPQARTYQPKLSWRKRCTDGRAEHWKAPDGNDWNCLKCRTQWSQNLRNNFDHFFVSMYIIYILYNSNICVRILATQQKKYEIL